MKDTFGQSVSITLAGESHGAGIVAILSGMAPGIRVNEDFIADQLTKRRPAGAISTARQEGDKFEILSGVFNGFTTGTPIAILIRNENTQSKDYSEIAVTARPGHADFSAECKYHGFQDYRGGGHFSGRITAGIVAAGAICVSALAEKGIEMATPSDIIKDPYVFEFLGVPENKPMLESDLEKALVAQIEKFLLELGRGFMFVGTQQRVTLNNTHYYVDMVFYNKILRAYVLIELKTTKLTPEAVGQLNMYLNYYAAEVNDEHDNPPIGIILCTDKDSVAAEYALGGLSNNIFALWKQ